jgi:hypothetical protein
MAESVDSPGKPSPVPWDSVLSQDLAKLDGLAPDTRDRCLSMLDRQEAHRRHLRWADRCLYGFGTLLSGGSVGAYVWVAVYFVNHHAPTQGAAILGGGAATLAGIFLGVRAKNRDRTGDLGRFYAVWSDTLLNIDSHPTSDRASVA